MNKKSSRFKTFVWLSLFAVSLLIVSAIILSGCTDTLKGDEDENLVPQVHFVNIPPEDFSFSYNPEVYWYGTDPDGLIDFYRYTVATAAAIENSGYTEPVEYAAALDDTCWIYVDVDPSQSDPQTAHIVPLSADTTDPVNTFVDQYVFVQAYDNDGAASLIAARRFNRNDHPPATRLWNVRDTPFVNAVDEGGIVTGIRLRWEGSDVTDYDEQGLVAPPFEFEWRLYGPFELDSLEGCSVVMEFEDEFGEPYDSTVWQPGYLPNATENVVVTNDGVIHYEGEELEFCDSIFDDTLGENGEWVVNCTTYVLDSAFFEDDPSSNAFFTVDTLIHIDSPDIARRLVASSHDGIDEWVWDTQDTIYNVFGGYSVDSTVSREFLFWVRCRDDAQVQDPTPAFGHFPVVEPKHEREVFVIDFTHGSMAMAGLNPSTVDIGFAERKTFWKELIENWRTVEDPGFTFDTTSGPHLPGDYTGWADFSNRLTLHKLLQYKVIIIVNDAFNASNFSLGTVVDYPEVLTAIDAGINAWVAARCLFVGGATESNPNPPIPPEMTHYFGVAGIFFTNWAAWVHSQQMDAILRMEDFCGAQSLDPTLWPELEVDTSRLHSLYFWSGTFNPYMNVEWRDDIAALPEVGWCQRIYGTEPMYLYKSIYGPNHFLGYPYTIEGTPVGHRYETDLFRTCWFMFTLPSLRQYPDNHALGAQGVANAVLDWLYDPTLGQGDGVTGKRYPGATVTVDLDEARAAYDARLSER